MPKQPNKVLEREISQDEAYQRSGHPILTVSPFVRALLPEMYEHQIRTPAPITSKEMTRNA
jgi:hypothetical protein